MSKSKIGWSARTIKHIKHHPVVLVLGALFGLFIMVGSVLGSFQTMEDFLPRHVVKSPQPLPDRSEAIEKPTIVRPQPVVATSVATRSQQNISSELVFNTLYDKSLTDLQRVRFVQRTKGTDVQWNGTVDSVGSEFVTEPSSPILVAFHLSGKPGGIPPSIVIAEFPHSAEGDLEALSPGDHVTILGRLDYTHLVGYDPVLRDCKLISFSKKSQRGEGGN